MKDRNWLILTLIPWKIVKILCTLFCALLLINILTAICYLTADPLSSFHSPWIGFPNPYENYPIVRNYYLSFLFPKLILHNVISITICIPLITILKHRYDSLKLTLFRKKYGNSEDLFKNIKLHFNLMKYSKTRFIRNSDEIQTLNRPFKTNFQHLR